MEPTGEGALMLDETQSRSFTITRADLAAYAEASGDHNPIHRDDEAARSVGLPGVIAHGMFLLALVARYLVENGVAPGEIRDIGAKFVRPVVVPPEGAQVTIGLGPSESDPSTLTVHVRSAGEPVFGPRGARVVLGA